MINGKTTPGESARLQREFSFRTWKTNPTPRNTERLLKDTEAYILELEKDLPKR